MRKTIYTLGAVAVLGMMTSPSLSSAEETKQEAKKDVKPPFMMMMDKDGNGTISKAEYVAAAEERFTKIDTNSDGSLTKEEMHAFKKKMRDEWKERHDKDKKGKGPDADSEDE